MRRSTTATAIVGLISTATLALGAFAAPAGAASVPGSSIPTGPSYPRPCLPATCPRTTSIQVTHPKNNELILYSTWNNAGTKPASVTYALSCNDGFTLNKTVSTGGSDQGQVVIPRVVGDPGVEICTASQTIPAGWTTTASTYVYALPGPPVPPYDYAYDFVRFAS
jgi:hypothetical protein